MTPAAPARGPFDPTRLDALLAAETPTVTHADPATGCTIWLKLEYQLPSGSTKDRLAAHVLSWAVAAGRVHAGSTVVEASSGSTSIAFAMACAALGVRFLAVLPEGVSNERLMIIRRYGGEFALVPTDSGMPGAIAETERLAAADPDVFLPRQVTRRGFAVGPSSGLNLAGARRLAVELGPGHHVATVCCDRMERYFSTDLFDDLR